MASALTWRPRPPFLSLLLLALRVGALRGSIVAVEAFQAQASQPGPYIARFPSGSSPGPTLANHRANRAERICARPFPI